MARHCAVRLANPFLCSSKLSAFGLHIPNESRLLRLPLSTDQKRTHLASVAMRKKVWPVRVSLFNKSNATILGNQDEEHFLFFCIGLASFWFFFFFVIWKTKIGKWMTECVTSNDVGHLLHSALWGSFQLIMIMNFVSFYYSHLHVCMNEERASDTFSSKGSKTSALRGGTGVAIRGGYKSSVLLVLHCVLLSEGFSSLFFFLSKT